MYSRSTKGAEKGDPNRNPWPAKNIPFTKELITAMKTAHASYQARLEEERNKRDFEMSKAKEKREIEERLKRKQEEETAAGKKIELRESECFEKEKQVRIDMDAANVLLKEGKHKLEAIMREKEIHRPSLQAAQMMIDTATNKTEQALKELEKIKDKQKEIEKEKTSILNKASASRGAREESKTESTKHSGKHHEHGSITKKESSLGKANNKGSEKTHGKDAIVIARQSASEEKTEDVNKRKTSEKTKRKSETTGSHEDVERKKRKSETTGSHEDVERKKGKSETTGSHEDVERKKQKHK